MVDALEDLRPRLLPTARFRSRSDGSAAVCDDDTGLALEVARDQATLLPLMDGQRTVAGLVEAHYAAHRSVPLAALDDLLKKLGAAGLLEGPSSGGRISGRLARVALPGVGWGSVGLVLLAVAALSVGPRGSAVLSSLDVLWAYAGAALALSLRRGFQGAAMRLLGEPPRSLEVRSLGGLLFVGPDTGPLVLLDRPARAGVLLAGIAGTWMAYALGLQWAPGIAFGAGAVAVGDLCPFAATSGGKLLATLAGRVDLREHARAYLDRRLLRRVTARSTFEGEGSLILSALASLAWLGWIVRLLFTRGAVAVLRLAAQGVGAEGAEKVLAYAGAAALALLMPTSLVLLGMALVRALMALRPRPSSHPGALVAKRAAQVELGTIPLFSRLQAGEFEALEHEAQQLQFSAGEAIVVQGEQGDRFFALISGSVAVEQEAESGLRQQVARLSAGDCFGEAALLGDGVRTATIRALEEVSVLSLGRAGFQRLQGSLQAEQLSSVLRASAALKRSAFFGSLPADRLSALAFRLLSRRVEAGEVVIRQGETGDNCYLVSEGTFEVLGDAGRAVASLGPGDHFGEVALLRDVPRTATVRAVQSGLLLFLGKQAFVAAVGKDLRLSRGLEDLAAQRVEAVR